MILLTWDHILCLVFLISYLLFPPTAIWFSLLNPTKISWEACKMISQCLQPKAGRQCPCPSVCCTSLRVHPLHPSLMPSVCRSHQVFAHLCAFVALLLVLLLFLQLICYFGWLSPCFQFSYLLSPAFPHFPGYHSIDCAIVNLLFHGVFSRRRAYVIYSI